MCLIQAGARLDKEDAHDNITAQRLGPTHIPRSQVWMSKERSYNPRSGFVARPSPQRPKCQSESSLAPE